MSAAPVSLVKAYVPTTAPRVRCVGCARLHWAEYDPDRAEWFAQCTADGLVDVYPPSALEAS